MGWSHATSRQLLLACEVPHPGLPKYHAFLNNPEPLFSLRVYQKSTPKPPSSKIRD
jgi:hypothetical protein